MDEHSKTSYSAAVSYEYIVYGRNYNSSRIIFGRIGRSRKSAKSVVGRYPGIETVEVYCDPKDPNNSVLEPGTPLSINSIIVVPIFATFIGLIFGAFGVGLLTGWLEKTED